MKKLLIGLCLILTTCLLSAQNSIVETQYGPIEGYVNNNISHFLGIPYASPPVGELRWRPPVAPDSWQFPLSTKEFPDKCAQKIYDQNQTSFKIEGTEDCLYLNVWSPDTDASLPVMVFIHGGGNQSGSTGLVQAGTNIYDGHNMAARGNVVVVTIQYRLGVFGYFVHPDLENENDEHTSGNYGIMDQIFALQWVQDNIDAFGGDKNNVTLFGESSGGQSTAVLMLSPEAKGLFHKAIIQSGYPLLAVYQKTMEKCLEFSSTFRDRMSDTVKIAFLRAQSPQKLVEQDLPPLKDGIINLSWGPVKDDYIFTNKSWEAVKNGLFNKMPLIIGSTSDEMSLPSPASISPKSYDQLVARFIKTTDFEACYNLYPNGDAAQAKSSYIQLLTDMQFTSEVKRAAECISLNQEEAVYRYFFSHEQSHPLVSDYGAYHGIDLFYVFNNWENSPYANQYFTNEDALIQESCLKYWTNFAHSGNPNGPGLEYWPQYEASQDNCLEIKAPLNGTQNFLRLEKCNFWNNIQGFEACTSQITSLTERSSDDFIIYPNPAKNNLFLKYSNPNKLQLKLFDSDGNLIYLYKNISKISLDQIPQGIYFLEAIFSDGVIIHEKLIINK